MRDLWNFITDLSVSCYVHAASLATTFFFINKNRSLNYVVLIV